MAPRRRIKRYVLTPARKKALRKAQLASAKKRRKSVGKSKGRRKGRTNYRQQRKRLLVGVTVGAVAIGAVGAAVSSHQNRSMRALDRQIAKDRVNRRNSMRHIEHKLRGAEARHRRIAQTLSGTNIRKAISHKRRFLTAGWN